MNIKNMYFPEVEVIKYKVPQGEQQEVRVQNGIISVIVDNPINGQKSWVRASSLKTLRDCNESIFEQLLWALDNIKHDMSMSKAELKRRLIKYSLISK